MRVLGRSRFEACVVAGEQVVGADGEGVCTVCLRTGQILSRAPRGTADDVPITALHLAGDCVVSCAADSTLQKWTAEGAPVPGSVRSGGAKVLLVGATAGDVFAVRQKVSATDESKSGKASWFELVAFRDDGVTTVIDGKLPRGAERPAKDGLAIFVEEGARRHAEDRIIAVCGRYHLQVYLVNKDQNKVAARLRHSSLENPFTALAVSTTTPHRQLGLLSESSVLVCGHRDGRVSVFHGVLNPKGERWGEARKKQGCLGSLGPPQGSFHWHAHAVRALAVSACGSACLSGGEEAVLVVWPLGRDGATSRDFLPRLGAPIDRLLSVEAPEATPRCSAHATLVVVATADAALHVVLLNGLKRLWSLYGLSQRYRRPRTLVMAADASRTRVSLNLRPGGLQGLDVRRDLVAEVVEVVAHNHVASTAETMKPRSPVVKHAAFANDGSALVTIDTWEAPDDDLDDLDDLDDDHLDVDHLDDSSDESSEKKGKKVSFAILLAKKKRKTKRDDDHLKFWVKDGPGDKFAHGWRMHSTLAAPHGAGVHVTCLRFHPTLRAVATGASDGSIKVWCCLELAAPRGVADTPPQNAAPHEPNARCHWRCAVTIPGKKKNQSFRVHALDFSSDGSVLAVARGPAPLVDLVDVASGRTLATLLRPGPLSSTSKAHHTFAQVGVFDDGRLEASGSPCVAVAHAKGLHVWDMTTATVAWAYATDLAAAAIASNHRQAKGAATIAVAVKRRGAARGGASVLLFTHERPEPLRCVQVDDAPRALCFVPAPAAAEGPKKPTGGPALVAELRGGAIVELLLGDGDDESPLFTSSAGTAHISNFPASRVLATKRKLGALVDVYTDEAAAPTKAKSSVFDFGRLLTRAPAWEADFALLPSVDAIFDAYVRNHIKDPTK